MPASIVVTKAHCPELREGIRITRQFWSGEATYLLEDELRGRFLHLGELEYQICRLCDGQLGLEEIRRAVNESNCLSLSQDNLKGFLKQLRHRGLLASENQQTGASARRSFGLLHQRWPLFNPDQFLSRLTKPLGFIFTFEFTLISGIFIAWGAVIMAANFSEISCAVRSLARVETIVPLLAMTLFVALIHEFAHGLVCKRFGGEVRDVGFLWIYLMPAFYCNVSSAWRFPNKWDRMLVTLAGPWSSLLICAIAVVLWRFSLAGSWIHLTSLLAISVTGVECLFNLNPLIKLDGYYLLSDWLEVPNLRHRSFSYLKQVFWISSDYEAIRGPKSSAKILAIYGVLALLYSAALVATILFLAGVYLMSEFKLLGLVIVVAVIAFVCRNHFAAAIAWPIERGARILNWSTRVPRAFISSMCLACPILGFCIYPWETTVVSDVQVCPVRRSSVPSVVDGIICEVYVQEGEVLETGAPLFRVRNTGLSLELKQIKAEVARNRSRLQLLQKGTLPEALELQRAKIATAEQSYQSACDRLKAAEAMNAESLSEIDAEIKHAELVLKHAERKSARLAELRIKKAISQSELEDAEALVEISSAKLQREIAHYRRVDADNLEDYQEQVELTSQLVEEAQREYKLMTAQPRPELITEILAQIESLEAKQDYLIQKSKALEVASPIDGVVITRNLNEFIESHVERGKVVVEIQDLSTVKIELLISENQIGDVVEGQRVTFKALAYPDKNFEGIVQTISPAGIGQKQRQSTFIVSTAINNEAKLLRPGMTGKAKISTGKRYWGSLVLNQFAKMMQVELWSWLPGN